MLNGIDISGWQKGILVDNLDCDFVIVKVSDGLESWTNSDWKNQVDRTLSSGKLLGLYHWCRGNDYKAEADNFLKIASNYIGRAVFMLDYESAFNKVWNTSAGPEWIKNWCEYIQQKTGVKPFVYIQASAKHVVPSGIKKLVAWYNYNQKTEGFQDFEQAYVGDDYIGHQYTSQGRLDGWAGNLDFDKFYGTRDDWAILAGKRPEKNTNTQKAPKLTDEELAKKVLNGEFGNGDDRVKALGDRYNAVQEIVNRLVAERDAEPKLTDEELAKKVLNGEFGNGDDRVKALGDRYDAVQEIVNKMLEPKITIDELARQVINGDWGNGDERRQKLEAAGHDYEAVQARVNKILS